MRALLTRWFHTLAKGEYRFRYAAGKFVPFHSSRLRENPSAGVRGPLRQDTPTQFVTVHDGEEGKESYAGLFAGAWKERSRLVADTRAFLHPIKTETCPLQASRPFQGTLFLTSQTAQRRRFHCVSRLAKSPSRATDFPSLFPPELCLGCDLSRGALV